MKKTVLMIFIVSFLFSSVSGATFAEEGSTYTLGWFTFRFEGDYSEITVEENRIMAFKNGGVSIISMGDVAAIAPGIDSEKAGEMETLIMMLDSTVPYMDDVEPFDFGEIDGAAYLITSGTLEGGNSPTKIALVGVMKKNIMLLGMFENPDFAVSKEDAFAFVKTLKVNSEDTASAYSAAADVIDADSSDAHSELIYLEVPGIAVRISEDWGYMKKGMTEEELARVTKAMTVAEVDEMYSENVYCSVFMDENKQLSIERDPSRDIFGPMTDEEKAQEFLQRLELKNAKEELQKVEFYISLVTGMKYGKMIAPSTQYEPAATAYYHTLLGNKDVEIICRDFDGTIDAADEALFDAFVDGISYGDPYGSLDPQKTDVSQADAQPDPAKVEAHSSANDASNPYASVIEKYQKAKEDDVSSAGEAFQRGISEWISSYDHVGYGLVNLDGNGIQEMVIAGIDPKIDPQYAEPVVFEIYTISEDVPVSLLCSEARNRYLLINDNKIINNGSGGASASITAAYRVEGDHLKFVEGLSTVNRSDSSGQRVFHTTNWYTSEYSKVPLGDYDRYDYTVPVDQYWPFLRELKALYWLPDLTLIA